MLSDLYLQGLVATLSLFCTLSILYSLRGTPLHFQSPINLKLGVVFAKYLLFLRVVIVFWCVLVPICILFSNAITVGELILILGVTPTITALMIAPELSLFCNSKLVVATPLYNSIVQIHLKKPYQVFDKATYQELLTLVEILPQYGITAIRLKSPMFYDASGDLRSMNGLKKALKKRHANFSHYPLSTFDCLLGKLGMLIYCKHHSNKPLNINKWHCINITLPTT
ncbi:hypothetical protein EXU30_07940 [Shewanella maritima]|uniref:Uncharacterized protein n=1 Tax=Shewanella maritima TaxID=2520507 RepID=A0A411PGA4_9GAMM|nr:hypothetical protein [Shewanella maritima]QBF82629.1 hypothetical protein EXU30_07940 [Shewanella maritima]